jgi:hypothetical protein
MKMQDASTRCAAIFLAAMLWELSETGAQEKPDGSLGFDKSNEQVKSFAASLFHSSPSSDSNAWVKFQWVGGRLHLDAPRHKQGSQSSRCNDQTETLTVSASRGLPKVHYVCSSRDWQWMLSFDDPVSMRIESLDRVSGNRAIAIQSDREPITIEYQQDGQSLRIESPSWIHLYHSDRVLIEKHFVPLIDCVVPHHTLAALANQTELAMLSILSDTGPLDLDVQSLVAQLKHPRRMKRREAERELLRLGTPTLSSLSELDSTRLNYHQRTIIAEVEKRLSYESSDNAATLAYRFINDPHYWVAWLKKPGGQPEFDDAMASHLARLGFVAQNDGKGTRVCLQTERETR